MRFSQRCPDDGGPPNPVAAARAELTAAGVAVTDLTDTNPTRHGLLDPRVLDAVGAAAARAGHYDPDPRGWVGAREALAARFGGHPDEYWLTASTSEAYGWAFTLLADPGDAVAIPTPGYPLIEPLARLAAIRTHPYRTRYLHPSGWEYDLDSVEAALSDPAVRALVVVNPNNPTGAYTDAAHAEALAGLCAAHGASLIADEVFWPFALDAPATHIRVAEAADATSLTLDGLSKLLAAPQLKLGWFRLSGAGDGEAARRLDAIADAYLSVNTPVALALPALLELADATVARVRTRLGANLATLHAAFADGGYRVRTAQGGWMALLDVPPLAAGTDLAVHLLRHAHLGVHPGWFYDLASPAALALSLLPEPEAFDAGCRRLRQAIDALD